MDAEDGGSTMVSFRSVTRAYSTKYGPVEALDGVSPGAEGDGVAATS